MNNKHFILSLVVVCCLFSCQSKERGTFTLVILPDTQTYAEKYPKILESQTSWIAENADQFTFVIQEGDLTQNNNDKEWKVVKDAFSVLHGKVPYTFVPGNHDMGSTPGKFADVRNTDMINRYLPLSNYKQLDTFGGAFETGKVDNTYHLFEAGGLKWLILSLEFGPRNETMDWANEVVKNHPDCQVIINTHAYLFSDSTHHDGEDWWRPQAYGIGQDSLEKAPNDGGQMWDKLVGQYENIKLVFSGHVLHDGEGTLVSTGKNGNKVYQMLANYQQGVKGSENGGNGFLRLVKIDTEKNTIEVKTYSPYLDQFMTDPEQQFTFENVKF